MQTKFDIDQKVWVVDVEDPTLPIYPAKVIRIEIERYGVFYRIDSQSRPDYYTITEAQGYSSEQEALQDTIWLLKNPGIRQEAALKQKEARLKELS